MEISEYLLIIAIFFVTSAVGVVTGSNSLIAVPALFLIFKDIDPKVAIATNMFGLTFMSIGASIPFFKEKQVETTKLGSLIVITLIGSALGALLIGRIESSESIKLIIAISMIAVSAFALFNPVLTKNRKQGHGEPKTIVALTIGYILSFILAIYGGFFSGGYVTMLTFVFVSFFAFQMKQAIATTKVINVFSSLIASVVFIYHGLVDFQLGALLAGTMFTGAFVGARVVTKLEEVWLRRLFFGAVVLISMKIIYDLSLG
jgi:uncharacterized membrane protein YfcA